MIFYNHRSTYSTLTEALEELHSVEWQDVPKVSFALPAEIDTTLVDTNGTVCLLADNNDLTSYFFMENSYV